MIVFLFSPDNDTVTSTTQIYVLWFALLGILQLVATVMRIGSFVYAGEKLTRRLRTMAYRAVLRQEVRRRPRALAHARPPARPPSRPRRSAWSLCTAAR